MFLPNNNSIYNYIIPFPEFFFPFFFGGGGGVELIYHAHPTGI